MCGICGIYGESNPQVIDDMLQAVAHRGPDDSEVVVTPRYSVGVARLSLVGNDRGRQPLISGDKRLAVLLNGEIYNYRQLQSLLDCPPSEVSEVETVARLYERYGAAAIQKLRGMFALAIIDSDRVILARDRFGIKPLFYTRSGGALLFASEIKALLKHPSVVPAVNRQALEEAAVFGFICSPDLTAFEGILQVPPGSVVIITEGSVKVEQYYQPTPACFADGPYYVDSESKRLLNALSSTLKQMMTHGNDEKGFYLSGGIDSSLLVALASEVIGRPVQTFTLYESLKSPDLSPARAVASAIGSIHTEFRVGAEEYLKELPHYVYHYENPVSGGVFDIHGGVAFHLLSRRIADHVRVAFSGEGADELFGGYYWSYCHPLGLSDRIRERLGRIGEPSPEVTRLVERVFPQPEDERVYQRNVFDLLVEAGLTNYHLWSVDRSSAAFGFEIRPAYLGESVADFALSLPIELKVMNGETKRVLRGAARRVLEKYGIGDVVLRQKWGMPAAIRDVAKQVEEYVVRTFPANRVFDGPFGKYCGTPLEAMMFDLFHWIFIEQRGSLPEGLDLDEYCRERRCRPVEY
ncbi:MAG: asparagine synthase (glutamine-hydrolyzing) [Firmicutes bacterium]|nr:asparagine synthase (glutamine-hydrolyzing) [Bacillota bacterium]